MSEFMEETEKRTTRLSKNKILNLLLLRVAFWVFVVGGYFQYLLMIIKCLTFSSARKNVFTLYSAKFVKMLS